MYGNDRLSKPNCIGFHNKFCLPVSICEFEIHRLACIKVLQKVFLDRFIVVFDTKNEDSAATVIQNFEFEV